MNAELYELVEKYLQGVLPDDEKRRLEQNLEQDLELAKEVQEYKALSESFSVYKKRSKLKHKLNVIHKDVKNSGSLPAKSRVYKLRVLGKRYFPTMAVAASVTLITMFGLVLTREYFRSLEHKTDSYYEVMVKNNQLIKNDLEAIKKNQNKLVPFEIQASSTATGFVLTSNGYLVTNQHVIKNSDSVYVESMTDHKRYKVEVVESDERLDLTILKIIDKKFVGFGRLPYTIAQRESDLGEPIYTLAFPREDMVFGEGSISAKSDFEGDTAKYQVSIPVNPGNSGSPVFDSQGNLVGIVSGRDRIAQGATSAIKSRYLYTLVDSLSKQDISQKVFLPQRNALKYLRRPDQIKQIQPFIFSVRVYANQK